MNVSTQTNLFDFFCNWHDLELQPYEMEEIEWMFVCVILVYIYIYKLSDV